MTEGAVQRLTPASGPSKKLVGMVSSLANSKALKLVPQSQADLHSPWRHIFMLGSILVIGLSLGGILSHFRTLQLAHENGVLQYVLQNISVLLVGFGFAIYGCVINRQLRLQLRLREELGPYTLKERLGSGGMGDVYLAEHRLLKRLCAVKLIRQDKADSPQLLQCFEDEVKATARLTHWNTVQVYDYGRTESGTFYYAMEYLRGLNLRQLVEQFGVQSPGRVVFILKQICASLHEAAQHGLVHRDIKPSNIFLTERGHMYDVAKLLDFGLVRPAAEDGFQFRNVSNQLQGSPRYMCPEQARGISPDCRGDLYSLGCVAYFLLTGHPPFDERNPVLLVVAHGTTPAPTFREIGVDVPEDLAAVVMKCLQKAADDRYASPRDLLQALQACQCDADWDWVDAENWWQQCEALLPTISFDQAEVAGATSPDVSESVRDPAAVRSVDEPDVTMVGETH